MPDPIIEKRIRWAVEIIETIHSPTSPDVVIEKRIRWAGLLICLGLVVQLLSLIWVHPLSFMAFLVVGCPLMLGGVLLYLYSLVPRSAVSHDQHVGSRVIHPPGGPAGSN
jgi:hypothetical protein